VDGWTEDKLLAVERAHPEGLSVQQIVELFAREGERLTEATFRKYVQVGLLPRSHRVGMKGKHRGSQGLYPATVVRQIDQLRKLMAAGFTIEAIQREFLFVRGDIGALERQLERVLSGLEKAREERSRGGPPDELGARELGDVRALAAELMRRLEAVERRLSIRARMAHAAV
jgi:hypothetical protein